MSHQDASAECPLCGRATPQPKYQDDTDIKLWECRTCGSYGLADRVKRASIIDRLSLLDKARLSAFTRARTRFGSHTPALGTKTLPPSGDAGWALWSVDDALAEFPHSVGGRLDRGLLNLVRLRGIPGDWIDFDPAVDYPLLFAEKPQAATFFIVHLAHRGLLRSRSGPPDERNQVQLTVDGWERVVELEHKAPGNLAQCFVAMCFDEELLPVYNDGIRPGVKEAGYEPVRLDQTEFIDNIYDEIAAEIRRSRLVVADFTGNRGNVYFEAGFAMGLGIPVLFSCHSDEIDNLQFDTKAYNHIVWKDAEDFRKKLKARILATVPVSGGK